MDSNQLIFPMFAMVLLTFSVVARLFFARRKSVAEGKVNAEYFKVYQGGAEPEASAQLARHFANLFEAPVLFYAVVAFALITKGADTLMIVLAWLFVLTRIVHAAIHIGPNKVRWRSPAFALGFAIVVIMWIKLFLHVVSSGVA